MWTFIIVGVVLLLIGLVYRKRSVPPVDYDQEFDDYPIPPHHWKTPPTYAVPIIVIEEPMVVISDQAMADLFGGGADGGATSDLSGACGGFDSGAFSDSGGCDTGGGL